MPLLRAQRTIVRKNSAGSDFLRRRVNLIEGSNVTLTFSDDTTNNETDVTIAAAGASGSVTVETPTGTVDGSNTTFTVSNEPKFIVVDGLVKFVTLHYTYSGGTIEITDGAPPVQFIRSVY